MKKSLLFLLMLSILGCKEKQNNKDKNMVTTTFYLIRHAEKDRSNLTEKNPDLTTQGLDRAKKWAEVLKNVKLGAVYSTNYKRVVQTAQPTADANHLEVTIYDPWKLNIDELNRQHDAQSVLIVGHSNTTPMLVNKLLEKEKYKDIDDTESGSLFIVTVTGNIVTDQLLIIN